MLLNRKKTPGVYPLIISFSLSSLTQSHFPPSFELYLSVYACVCVYSILKRKLIIVPLSCVYVKLKIARLQIKTKD